MTKTGWEKIKGKGQWDVQVALRGPDSNYGETLKWFTTSVIRGQMAEIIRVGGLVNPDLNLVVLPHGGEGELTEAQSKALNCKHGWNYHHFCSHIRTAADWLEIPVLQIEESLWHKVMSSGSSTRAIDAIVERAAMFHDANSGEKSPFGKHSLLYTPTGIDELIRHQKDGRIYS